MSEVQSLFWKEGDFTEKRGGFNWRGGAFLLEDTTLCGGGVHFDLEEGV